MALKYMEGFDAMFDRPDMQRAGWTGSFPSSGSYSAYGSVACVAKSLSGKPGRSAQLVGPWANTTYGPAGTA